MEIHEYKRMSDEHIIKSHNTKVGMKRMEK